MKKSNKHITDAQLLKCLLNELPAVEKEHVLKAKNEDGQAMQRFEQLQMVWDTCGMIDMGCSIDVNEAWYRFRQRVSGADNTNIATCRIPAVKWIRAAALLLILAGAYWLGNGLLNKKTLTKQHAFAGYKVPHSQITKQPATVMNKDEMPVAKEDKKITVNNRATHHGKRKAQKIDMLPVKEQATVAVKTDKELLCNSTASPIEICIIQKQVCAGGKAAILPSCSRLAPNETGALQYHVSPGSAKKCNTTIDEIIIKKITTGETLVLDEHSKPAAGELFSYMTGAKKGDITAGEFNSDCLAFNGSTGDFVLRPCTQMPEDCD
ncbi:MAG: hypothetical protein BGO69_15230 [Bacteroidetes bacterium 46-16]|nr:MAG: hypothetical protein BGO69_15230 [Bacteroidetes bacterium 46-16]